MRHLFLKDRKARRAKESISRFEHYSKTAQKYKTTFEAVVVDSFSEWMTVERGGVNREAREDVPGRTAKVLGSTVLIVFHLYVVVVNFSVTCRR